MCSYPEPDTGDALPISFHVNIFPHLHLGLLSGLFLRFPRQYRVCTFPPIRATCPAYPGLVLITRITFGEEYRLRGFSLCSQRMWNLQRPKLNWVSGPNLTEEAREGRVCWRESRISQFPRSADWFILGINSHSGWKVVRTCVQGR